MGLKLLPNSPLNLTEETDLLGTINKAKAIQSFLIAYKDQLGGYNQNKMLALYGEWGSGKSSVLDYLQNHLPKGDFTPILFDTWKNEKDSNLPASLIYAISQKADTKFSKQIAEILDFTFAFLKGFTKGISIKIGTEGFGVNFSNKDVLETLEKHFAEAAKAISHTQKTAEFEAKFTELEDLILGKNNHKKLIVFIDDLDRCEPENVLNLLSAMKLFFTYGKRTIFLSAIDKKAVDAAVKTRYKEMVNSEEYLEKVFDISFSMPKLLYTVQLVEQYIPKDTSGDSNSALITDLFIQLGFKNPRHLKKVLNKLDLLRSMKLNPELNPFYRSLIPNILDREGGGSLIETVITLFFIILHEFHPDRLEELEAYETKLNHYAHRHKGYLAGTEHLNSAVASINQFYLLPKYKTLTLRHYIQAGNPNVTNQDPYTRFVVFFAPQSVNQITIHSKIEEFISNFSQGDLLIKFCIYLMENRKRLTDNYNADYRFWHYFELCKTLL